MPSSAGAPSVRGGTTSSAAGAVAPRAGAQQAWGCSPDTACLAGRPETPGEELERGSGLRLPLSRELDAACVEVRLDLGRGLGRLGGRARGRQLEHARVVRVQPELGDELALEPR